LSGVRSGKSQTALRPASRLMRSTSTRNTQTVAADCERIASIPGSGLSMLDARPSRHWPGAAGRVGFLRCALTATSSGGRARREVPGIGGTRRGDEHPPGCRGGEIDCHADRDQPRSVPVSAGGAAFQFTPSTRCSAAFRMPSITARRSALIEAGERLLRRPCRRRHHGASGRRASTQSYAVPCLVTWSG
jgi:hypothetical protein